MSEAGAKIPPPVIRTLVLASPRSTLWEGVKTLKMIGPLRTETSDGVGSALRKILLGSWLIDNGKHNEKSGGPDLFRIDEGAARFDPSLRMLGFEDVGPFPGGDVRGVGGGAG